MSVRLAMVYNEIDVTELGPWVIDDDVVFEQKVDGTRSLAVVVTDQNGKSHVRFLGRGGQALSHTAAMQHFKKIERALVEQFTKQGECVLDGEIMIDTGEYVVFDLPYLEVQGTVLVSPENIYRERRQMLSALLSYVSLPVRKIPWAQGEEAKMTLFKRVAENGGEGVMAKRLDSPYQPGRRVSHSVKVKFIKTADVVVMEVNRPDPQHGSISFGVYVDGELKPLSGCSAIGKPYVERGDVIEVAYLAYTGGLVQPRMLQVRTDKKPEDCVIEQLPAYSKEVLVP